MDAPALKAHPQSDISDSDALRERALFHLFTMPC
jgi:hypothetical protein